MAVAKMLKLQLISHKSLNDNLIHSLQENGLIEIRSIESSKTKDNGIAAPPKASRNDEEEIEKLKILLAGIGSAIDFIDSNNHKKQGFIASMFSPKTNIKKKYFFEIEKKLDLENTLKELSELEILLNETTSKIEELNKLEKDLLPWKELNISTSLKLKNVEIITGQLLASKVPSLTETLEEKIKYLQMIKVSEYHGKTYLAVLCHRNYTPEVKNILNGEGFQSVTVPSTDSCNKDYKNTLNEISNSKENLKVINKKIKSIIKHKEDLMVAEALIENKLNKLLIQENFIHTNEAVFIEGWIPEKAKDKAVSVLDVLGKEIDYTFIEPTKNENPPIILDNPPWLKPLEAVTTLYGYPSYREKDPTLYMAPFFLIFFGLSIGDVGYGLIIAFLAWVLRKKLPISDKGKEFLKLFIYGGLVSIPAGVLTGSWLALDLKYLPQFIQKMAITDPMKNPMPFMIFCLGLGFIHLYWGVIIEMMDGFKENVSHSLMDNLPVLLFLPGFAVLIVLVFYSTSGITPTWSPFAKWFALVGAGSVVLFTNREGKNVFTKIGGGLYNLYGMTSFIGDTISYARLMALGLATFLIGQAINIMAQLFFSLFGLFFGIIVATIIIVVGHLFNIMINLIGAFIHPARLQYVEFFTKFFEGGGKSFQAFKLESKTLNIIEMED